MRRSWPLLVALVAGIAASAQAEVRSLTLGIRVNCPYGLAG
jgi:hypothetical protein